LISFEADHLCIGRQTSLDLEEISEWTSRLRLYCANRRVKFDGWEAAPVR